MEDQKVFFGRPKGLLQKTTKSCMEDHKVFYGRRRGLQQKTKMSPLYGRPKGLLWKIKSFSVEDQNSLQWGTKWSLTKDQEVFYGRTQTDLLQNTERSSMEDQMVFYEDQHFLQKTKISKVEKFQLQKTKMSSTEEEKFLYGSRKIFSRLSGRRNDLI